MNYSTPELDISGRPIPLNTIDIFGNNRKTALEIGFGEGEFIAEIASTRPEWNFIGIEVKFYRFKKASRLITGKGLQNVRLIHMEASLAVHELFSEEIIDRVYINFPDPWPKEKHLKHRLINKNFVEDLFRIMKSGAEIEFVSDSPDYISHTSREFGSFTGFEDISENSKLDENHRPDFWRNSDRKTGRYTI